MPAERASQPSPPPATPPCPPSLDDSACLLLIWQETGRWFPSGRWWGLRRMGPAEEGGPRGQEQGTHTDIHILISHNLPSCADNSARTQPCNLREVCPPPLLLYNPASTVLLFQDILVPGRAGSESGQGNQSNRQRGFPTFELPPCPSRDRNMPGNTMHARTAPPWGGGEPEAEGPQEKPGPGCFSGTRPLKKTEKTGSPWLCPCGSLQSQ